MVGIACKELFWDRKAVSYTQTMTHIGKLGYFRISGVFVENVNCNLFQVFDLSVWRKRKIVTVHRFSDK